MHESRSPQILVAPAWLAIVLSVGAYGFYFSSDDPFFALSASQQPEDIDRLLDPVGRWLNAILLKASFEFIDGLDDFLRVRLATAALLVVFVLAMSRILVRHGVEPAVATILCAAALLTPSTMPILAWAQHWTVAFGACLVALGFMLVLEAEMRPIGTATSLVLGAGALLFLAASINQQLLAFAGVFFFVLVYHSRSVASIALRTVLSAGATSVGYLLSFLAVRLAPGGPGERTGLTTDIPGKLDWFLSEPLTNAALLVVFPRAVEGLMTQQAVASLILLVLTSAIVLLRPGSLGENALVAALFPVSIILAYAPTLAVSENWASYRTLWPLQTLLLLSLLLSVHAALARSAWPGLCRTVSLSVFFVLSILWLAQFQTHVKGPYGIEAEHARDRIVAHLAAMGEGADVKVIYPHWSEAFPGVQYYDDIGGPIVREWSVVPLVLLIAREQGIDLTTSRVQPISFEGREASRARGSGLLDLSDYATSARTR